MTIEEYKEAIIKKLGLANDCEETEQIIMRSISKMEERNILAHIRGDYLVKLKMGLKDLSSKDFDYIHWCNIQCAILYLRKITTKEDLK